MAGFWDPRALLDIYPEDAGFTCVGTTRQGRRCRQWMLSRTSLTEAENILYVLEQHDIFYHGVNEWLYPKLHRLAVVTLCPRWHRHDHPTAKSQAGRVALKWLNIVDRYVYDETYFQQTPAPVPLPAALPSTILTVPSNTMQQTANPPTQVQTHHALAPSFPPTPAPSQNQAQTTTSSNTPVAMGSPHQQTQASLLAHALLSNPQLRAILMEILTNLVLQFSGTNNHHHSHGTLTPSPQSPPSSPTPPQSAPPTASIIAWLDTNVEHASAPSTPSGSSPSTPDSAVFTATSTLSQLTPLSSQSTVSTPSTPAVGPVALFPSPPESIWSMGPPSETPSITSEPSSRSPTPSLPEEDVDQEPSLAFPDTNPPSTINDLPSNAVAPVTTPPQATQPHDMITSNTSSPTTASSPAEATSTPSLSESDPPTHALSPVIRKPLTDCPVCFLPITDASDAVWCRGSCGQNMCYGCFLLWANQLLDQERQVECGYCRAAWIF